MKDLTHYFQSPNKVVNTNNSSLEDCVAIEKSSTDLKSDYNASVSPCFEGSRRNEVRESANFENRVFQPEECQGRVKENSSAARNGHKCLKDLGKPGYVNGISNCGEDQNSKQLKENPGKETKKKCSEVGCDTNGEKHKCGDPENCSVDTPVSPNAFQVLMSTQQVFSSTNSGRKNSPLDVENGQLKRENKKKITENLEQMAKRKLGVEANVKACENIVLKCGKKRRRIIVESDSENEVTSVSENSPDAAPDQTLGKKNCKQQKSGHNVNVERKLKRNKVSEDIADLEDAGSGVAESQEFNYVHKKDLKCQENKVKKSKNMKINVCNKHDKSKPNDINVQRSTSDTRVKGDLEVISISGNEKCSGADSSAAIVNANDLSDSPDVIKKKGNILNYFNKVASDVKQRHTEKIKVTADVHFPVVSGVKVFRKVVVKRRSKNKGQNDDDDIQLIDTEIIEKQNLPDSETNKSFAALSETKLPCTTRAPVQADSECKVTPTSARKNWKIRIQIKPPSPANHKESAFRIKKRKLKISSAKQTRNSETTLNINHMKESNELLLNNNSMSEQGKISVTDKKLQSEGEQSPGSRLQRKKKMCVSESTPVKSKPFRNKAEDISEIEDTADNNEPLSRRMKEVLDNQSKKIKNSSLELNECFGRNGKTPKGRRTFFAEKASNPILESVLTVNKGYPFKKCSEGDQSSLEKNTVKGGLKRKRSHLLHESFPKKSGAKSSPIKKTVKNNSPAKENCVKKVRNTLNRDLGRGGSVLAKEESPECTFVKKNDDGKEEMISSKKNIGEDCQSMGKKGSSPSKQEKNLSSEGKNETLTIVHAKRSCTKKNTTYAEDYINSPRKSKRETAAFGRKRSLTARTSLQEEGNVFQSSKMFECSSAGRRSSPRKKSVFQVADYGISDDEDEDFDDDSDDDFFGDSDDYYDSDLGDSDENYEDSGDHLNGITLNFVEVKKRKNDKSGQVLPERKCASLKEKIASKRKCSLLKGKIASKSKCVSLKRKEVLSKSIPISKKYLEAAFREKIALSKGKRANSKEKTFDQEVVLQFIKKAKGTLNRKMALHDPENFSCEQMVVAEKKSEPIKLAPLFASQKTKKLDKATMMARKTFLQSGVPEVLKKMVEVQKLAEEQEHVEFPSISHIQQKEDNVSVWNLSDALKEFPPIPEVSLSASLKVSKGDFTKFSEGTSRTTGYSASQPPKIRVFREFLRCIKAESRDFPVYRTFKYLHEASHLQQLGGVKGNAAKKGKRKSSLAKKKEQAYTVQDSEQRSAAWTAKYQPLSSTNILGNGYNISRFKKWLELWVQVKENTFQKKLKEDVSSGDEFLDDASDDESGRTVLPKKSVVLMGPTGSGKTMTVYALAHELGFKVLEVNAASKRTGRRILSELLEATQSHQVQGKGDETASGIKSFFTSKGTSEKTKHPKKETEQISKLSLILVDDVDVVFEEEDDGFVSALSTLVVGSKRPVVLVTSDSSCPHLPRFMENSLVLEFQHPPSNVICVWMQLVALLEGVRVRKSCVEELLQFNKGDVRKTLLQLQFWVLSGGDNSKANPKPIHETAEIQDFPDDVSNSSWVSLDDKKIENEINHPLHSQCLCSFLELDNQILQIDMSKIWWNMPKLAGLDQVSHQKETSEKCDKECEKEITSIASVKESSLESESTIENDNEAHKKWRSVCSADHMRVLVQLTDTLSIVEELSTASDCVVNEPYQCAWEKSPLDSLSLSQDMRPSACGTKLTAQSIGNWLVFASVNQSSMLLCPEKNLCLANVIQQQPPREQMSLRDKQHNACREFEDAISMLYWPQRRAVTMDYMPCLRTISRLEHDRVSVNDKRNNRFFHYLRGLGTHPSPAALDTACNVFNSHNNL